MARYANDAVVKSMLTLAKQQPNFAAYSGCGAWQPKASAGGHGGLPWGNAEPTVPAATPTAGLAFFMVVVKVGEAGLAHGWLSVRRIDGAIIPF